MKDKKFEITQDDLRVGTNHVVRKMAAHLSTMETGGSKSEDKKDFSEIQEFDLEGKITTKELAEAFNKLVAALKK